MDTELNFDSPIENLDEDLLERGEFLSQISKRICLSDGDPCTVFSLEGQWGSGKTSAINLIKKNLEKIEDAKRPIIVEFNPWMIGSLDSLVQHFFQHVISSLNDFPQSNKKILKNLSLSLAKYSLSLSEGPLSAGVKKNYRVINALSWTFQSVLKRSLSAPSLAVQKNTIYDEIRKLNKPLVIFIDDIDRLPPQEVLAMIRLIKAVSDFPRTAYVIALDPNYIAKALKKSGIERGQEYLDKIIQDRISLPQITPDWLRESFDQELKSINIDELLKKFPGEQDRLTELYHFGIKYLLRTPRDIKRIFNRVRRILPTIKEDVGIADLLSLETIAIIAPDLYEDIRTHPQSYVNYPSGSFAFSRPGTLIIGERNVATLEEEKQERILSNYNYGIQIGVIGLRNQLFPLTKDRKAGGGNPQQASGRIACPENLNIVLSCSLLSSRISLKQIRELMEMPEKRRGIFSFYKNPQQFKDLMHQLNDYFSLNPTYIVPDTEDFIEVIADVAESDVVTQIDYREPILTLDMSARRLILQFTIYLLTQEEGSNKEKLIKQIIKSSDKLALSTSLLVSLCRQHGRLKNQEGEKGSVKFISKDLLDDLIVIWTRQVINSFASGSIFNKNEAETAFYLLKEFDIDAVHKIVLENLDPSSNFDRLVKLFPGGYDGDGRYYEVTEQYLNEVIDSDNIDKLKKLATQRLKDPKLEPRLKSVCNSIVSGEKNYINA